MKDSILIVKRRGSKTELKVTKKMRSGYAPSDFVRLVNLTNFRDICLCLHDLEDLCDAPIEKAVRQYLVEKSSGWPF
jgi:hypothetical protein